VSSGDVGAEARRRACISLTRRASEVWSTFSKAEKVRVASIFSELVLYYARTRRMPVASIDIVLQAADVVKEAYEICLKEKGELEKAVARFRGEVEELREKVSALGGAESRFKAEVEELRGRLAEAQEQVKQLKAANDRLSREAETLRRRLSRLRFICREYATLSRMAGSEWERAELDVLCQEASAR